MSNVKRDTPKKRSKGATTVAPIFRDISEEFFYEFLATVLVTDGDNIVFEKHTEVGHHFLFRPPSEFVDTVVELRAGDEGEQWTVLVKGEEGYAGQWFSVGENRLLDVLYSRLNGWFLGKFQRMRQSRPVKEPPTKGKPRLKVVK